MGSAYLNAAIHAVNHALMSALVSLPIDVVDCYVYVFIVTLRWMCLILNANTWKIMTTGIHNVIVL